MVRLRPPVVASTPLHFPPQQQQQQQLPIIFQSIDAPVELPDQKSKRYVQA